MSEQRFAGFPAEVFDWFAGLEADNSKAYFSRRRGFYDEHVRGGLELLLEELADELGGRIKLFRQHRDTRFSADKSPYKTTTYGVIQDRSGSPAPLYAQLSSVGLFAGTGYYRMEADQLERFRAAVDDDAAGARAEAAVAEVRAAGVEVFGESLKTAPRGYPRDHPRVALLRHRALFAGARLPAGTGLARAAALDHARTTWAACAPLNAWLDSQVGVPRPASDRARPDSGGRPPRARAPRHR